MTRHCRTPRVCLSVLLCLSPAAPAAADYHDTFINAIRMFRGERWKEAASLFQSARAMRPREAGRVQISGNDTEPYLPSYFLGESLYRLGDCSAALQAWGQAERSPDSLTQRMASHIARAQASCQQSGITAVAVAPPSAAPRDPRPTLNRSRPPVSSPDSTPAGDTPRFRAEGDIPGPRRVKYVPPVYSAAARAAGISGSVVIEATVGTDGRVSDARVVRSVEQLDQAAIDAVGQWEFTPTVVNGIPVPVVMTVTVFFSAR